MSKAGEERWDRARGQVIGRWRMILERIEACDEGGVLELSNGMDEFCDEAIALKSEAAPGADAGTRCLFCRGFLEMGGCLGLLGQVDQAVLSGKWDAARRLAEDYIVRLESINCGGAS